MTIFDRSWYGRVLVERVEGFASPAEWQRAFAEINQFEDQLIDHGVVLVKYWIHVTKDEQLRRFEERQASAVKRWKISGEDWRNREKWDAYEQAVSEMIERTSTRDAPWTLIEGNDKQYARVAVLRAACERLRKQLWDLGRGRAAGLKTGGSTGRFRSRMTPVNRASACWGSSGCGRTSATAPVCLRETPA